MKYLLLLLLIPIMSCAPTVIDLEANPFVVDEIQDYDLDGICRYGGVGYYVDIRCKCVYYLGDTIKLDR